jgi:hypothetical protein
MQKFCQGILIDMLKSLPPHPNDLEHQLMEV